MNRIDFQACRGDLPTGGTCERDVSVEDKDVESAVLREQYAEILRRLVLIDNGIAAQNGRIRRLEEWRWKAVGALGLAGMGVAYLLK